MPNETTVSLKVYIIDGNNSMDIRRFEVDQSVITSYDYLRERLQMIIPKLRGKNFKLLWQDTEGDEVTISSDEELLIALMDINSNVCKFTVRVKSNDDSQFYYAPEYDMFSKLASYADHCPAFTEVKEGLTCSCCQKPITGVRYKCIECVHYYQCVECENKNEHADHVMLRLQKSMSFSTVVHKCMQILKNHLIQGSKCVGVGAIFRDKVSQSGNKEKEKEKEKCGGSQRRRFRKHGHHAGSSKHGQDDSPTECPFNGMFAGNLHTILNNFLDMYKNTLQSGQAEPEKREGNPADPPQTGNDVSDTDMNEPSAPVEAKMDENVEPSTSNEQAQKEARINMALQFLAEMGFKDENNWLSRLLEHFDGDIAKTIDHLMLGK